MSAQLLFLSEADTERVLRWPEVIACLSAAYQAPDDPGAAPPRVVARMGSAWLRALAAMSTSGRHMGVKIIGRARTPQSSYLIPLWDQASAELVCLLDGKHITAMRTAGTTAAAVDPLPPAGGGTGRAGARERDRDGQPVQVARCFQPHCGEPRTLRP